MANYCVYSGGNGTSGAVAGSVPTATEWSNAYQSISACLTAITEVDNDVIFVANDHSYSAGANITIAPVASISVISIDRSNTTTATPLAGALEESGGNFSANITPSPGNVYFYGLTLKTGSGASQGSTNIVINNNTAQASTIVLDTCVLWVNSTNTGPSISYGGADIGGFNKLTRLINCTFRFGNISQRMSIAGHPVEMQGCSISPLSSTASTLLISSSSRGMQTLKASACDFSNATALINVASDNNPCIWSFTACKVPATVFSGTHPGLGSSVIELMACGTSTDDHNYQYAFIDGSGQINQNTGVYLTTGGASFTDTNGSLVPVSLQEVSSANASKVFPLKTPWFNVEVPSTGSKTFSVKIANTVAALKDTEVWLELEYMADSANPMTTNVIDAPVVSGTNSLDILAAGTNRTDTAEAWTGITGEITHTLSKTVTVNQIGWARARVCLAKASTTIYVDPQVTVA